MSTPPLVAQLSSEDWNDFLPQCVLCGARLPTLAEVRRHLQCDHTVLPQDMGGLMLRVTDGLGLHSCRLCGTPLVRLHRNIWDHLRLSHGRMTPGEYAEEFGGVESAMRETEEERRVNQRLRRLRCPKCPNSTDADDSKLVGLGHILLRHVKGVNNLYQVLGLASEHLGLVRCKSQCRAGLMLKDAVEDHEDHFHRGRHRARIVINVGGSERQQRKLRQLLPKVVQEDEVQVVPRFQPLVDQWRKELKQKQKRVIPDPAGSRCFEEPRKQYGPKGKQQQQLEKQVDIAHKEQQQQGLPEQQQQQQQVSSKKSAAPQMDQPIKVQLFYFKVKPVAKVPMEENFTNVNIEKDEESLKRAVALDHDYARVTPPSAADAAANVAPDVTVSTLTAPDAGPLPEAASDDSPTEAAPDASPPAEASVSCPSAKGPSDASPSAEDAPDASPPPNAAPDELSTEPAPDAGPPAEDARDPADDCSAPSQDCPTVPENLPTPGEEEKRQVENPSSATSQAENHINYEEDPGGEVKKEEDVEVDDSLFVSALAEEGSNKSPKSSISAESQSEENSEKVDQTFFIGEGRPRRTKRTVQGKKKVVEVSEEEEEEEEEDTRDTEDEDISGLDSDPDDPAWRPAKKRTRISNSNTKIHDVENCVRYGNNKSFCSGNSPSNPRRSFRATVQRKSKENRGNLKKPSVKVNCAVECQAFNPLVDGCLYPCPLCEDNAVFRSLDAVTGHVKEKHPTNMDSLELVRDTREEKFTTCHLCGQSVVQDRIELGYHAWTEHGLPLEAYVAYCE